MHSKNKLYRGGGWLDVGWLEKAEIKPTQPSWSLSWAELGNKDFWSKLFYAGKKIVEDFLVKIIGQNNIG